MNRLIQKSNDILEYEQSSSKDRQDVQMIRNSQALEYGQLLSTTYEQRLSRLEQHFVNRRKDLAHHYAELQSKWTNQEYQTESWSQFIVPNYFYFEAIRMGSPFTFELKKRKYKRNQFLSTKVQVSLFKQDERCTLVAINKTKQIICCALFFVLPTRTSTFPTLLDRFVDSFRDRRAVADHLRPISKRSDDESNGSSPFYRKRVFEFPWSPTLCRWNTRQRTCCFWTQTRALWPHLSELRLTSLWPAGLLYYWQTITVWSLRPRSDPESNSKCTTSFSGCTWCCRARSDMLLDGESLHLPCMVHGWPRCTMAIASDSGKDACSGPARSVRTFVVSDSCSEIGSGSKWLKRLARTRTDGPHDSNTWSNFLYSWSSLLLD